MAGGLAIALFRMVNGPDPGHLWASRTLLFPKPVAKWDAHLVSYVDEVVSAALGK